MFLHTLHGVRMSSVGRERALHGKASIDIPGGNADNTALSEAPVAQLGEFGLLVRWTKEIERTTEQDVRAGGEKEVKRCAMDGEETPAYSRRLR